MIAAAVRILSYIGLCAGAVAHGQTSAPDTPAGRTLSAMLNALNSGDRTVVSDYVARYGRGESVDDVLRSAQRIGRLDLVEVVASEPQRLQFIVGSASGGLRLLGMLEVENADPARVTFSLPWTPLSPGASIIGFDVDAETRARVVAAAAERLRQLYVLPESAAEMAESLTTRLRSGGYDAISDGWRLANELTEHLRRVNADPHLFVGFSPVAGGPSMPTPNVAQPRPMNPADCGFERAEVLDGNVGYIKINELADPARCGAKTTDVLRSVGDATAAIFDLRDALGGNAGMPMLIYAQLFDSPARVSGVQWRDSPQVQELRWAARADGVHLTDIPVYVLTSAQTFSGAEAFAYDLQALKRATIVGEPTKGGAHIPQLERIDTRFVLSLPRGRAVNPITGTNWEGLGVRPEVAVPAGEALPTALSLARGATPR